MPTTDERRYDRRVLPADSLLVTFLLEELERARTRIAELEAQVAAHACATAPTKA